MIILLKKHYSHNPADRYLEFVLCQNFKGEFTTHLHNTNDKGFSDGHYFTDLETAVADFDKRRG